MKAVFSVLSIVVMLVVSGCASGPQTGCSPKQAWYQPGRDEKQTMRDLAACQNEALAYGRSANGGTGEGGARGIAFAMIANSSENNRQNNIVKSCMLAKGYTIVDRGSTLLTGNDTTPAWNPPVQPDSANDARLVGRWVTLVTNRLSGLQGRFEYSFLPQNHYKAFLDDGSTNKQAEQGRYYVKGSKLVTWSDTDEKSETFTFTLTESRLTITISGTTFAFQKADDASTDDARVENALLGNWESIAFKGKAVGDGVVKLKLSFLPNNQCQGTTIQNGKVYVMQGSYKVRGGSLYCEDANSPPDKSKFALLGDTLVIQYMAGDAEFTFQRVRTITP